MSGDVSMLRDYGTPCVIKRLSISCSCKNGSSGFHIVHLIAAVMFDAQKKYTVLFYSVNLFAVV